MQTETPFLPGELPPAESGVSAAIDRTLEYLQRQRRADGTWVGGLLRPTRQVQPGYPEPDPDRAAIALVRRLSAEDFGPTAMRVGADGTLRPPV